MFVCAFVFFFPMGLFSFRLDKVLGILFIAISIMSLAIIAMTPTSYVFSKEGVVIRYIFGLEENIMWTKVLSVMTELEISSRFYISRYEYELTYLEEKKKCFFMQGRIAKNKKTTELMKKYCPKKID